MQKTETGAKTTSRVPKLGYFDGLAKLSSRVTLATSWPAWSVISSPPPPASTHSGSTTQKYESSLTFQEAVRSLPPLWGRRPWQWRLRSPWGLSGQSQSRSRLPNHHLHHHQHQGHPLHHLYHQVYHINPLHLLYYQVYHINPLHHLYHQVYHINSLHHHHPH